jgi:O-antigen/teichoic acid export membrane protein
MRELFRRFLVLASTTILTQLIAFGTLAITTRRVGPSNLGAYTVALALITFASLPIAYGITAVGTRDVAQQPDRARELAGEVFVLQLVLVALAYALIAGLGPVIAPNHAMRSLLPIVGLFLLTSTSFEWALQALGRMRSIAVARISGQIAFGLAVPFLVVGGLKGMERYAWLMIGGLALKHVATTLALVKTTGVPGLAVSPRRLWRRLKKSAPMGYASVVVQIYGTIDQVMLGYLSTAYQAGEYAAAGRIPGAIQTASSSWTSVVFPHSAALARTDKERLRRQTGWILAANAMVSLPIAVCTPFVAHDLMVAAFGARFGPAGTTLALGALGLGITLVDGTLATLVLGLGCDRYYARALTLTALLNVALNVPVIPLFGRNGAVIDALVCECLLFALLARLANRQLGGISMDWDRIIRVAYAVVPAVDVLTALDLVGVSVWLRIVAGGVTYVAFTLVFGAISTAEIRRVFTPRFAPATRRRSREVEPGRSAAAYRVPTPRVRAAARAAIVDELEGASAARRTEPQGPRRHRVR